MGILPSHQLMWFLASIYLDPVKPFMPTGAFKCVTGAFKAIYVDSEGFKGGTLGTPIMPRDAVSRTANIGTVGTNGFNNFFF